MSEVLDEPEDYDLDPEIHAGNLFQSILFKPRETFRFIFLKMPDKYLWQLFVVAGMIQGVSQLASRKEHGEESVYLLILYALVAGAALGWILYFIYAWLMKILGKLFNGQATASELRVVLAWSIVPRIPVLFIDSGLFILEDAGIINTTDWSLNTAGGLLLMLMLVVELGLAVWSIAITIAGVKLVQQFSTGTAILNIILPGFLLFLILVSLAMLFFVGTDFSNTF